MVVKWLIPRVLEVRANKRKWLCFDLILQKLLVFLYFLNSLVHTNILVYTMFLAKDIYCTTGIHGLLAQLRIRQSTWFSYCDSGGILLIFIGFVYEAVIHSGIQMRDLLF